mgnify:FL=1
MLGSETSFFSSCFSLSSSRTMLHSYYANKVQLLTAALLGRIPQEIEAIALGTVVLATADASELQPLFEALYLRWQCRSGPLGRVFKEWKTVAEESILNKQKRALSRVIEVIKQTKTNSARKCFDRWADTLIKKHRRTQLNARMMITDMFNKRAWAFRRWRTYFVQSVRSQTILDKVTFRALVIMWRDWHFFAQNNRAREQRRKIAERQGFRAKMRLTMSAWTVLTVKHNLLKTKFRSSEKMAIFKGLSSNFFLWRDYNKRVQYKNREVMKAARWWSAMHLREWKLAARKLRHTHYRCILVRKRVDNRLLAEVPPSRTPDENMDEDFELRMSDTSCPEKLADIPTLARAN